MNDAVGPGVFKITASTADGVSWRISSTPVRLGRNVAEALANAPQST